MEESEIEPLQHCSRSKVRRRKKIEVVLFLFLAILILAFSTICNAKRL